MTVHLFYVAGTLLWNALAAAAWRREGGPGGRWGRVLTLGALAATVLGLPWMAHGMPSGAAPALFSLSALLPVGFSLAAAQAVRAARRGQPEAWILALFHGLMALLLATRWAWEIGWTGEGPLAAISVSYAGVQSAAFAPALWFPQFVHLPWLARPERPLGGAAGFVWWIGVSFAALAAVFTVAGSLGADRMLRSWRAPRTLEGNAPRPMVGAAPDLVLATRLPPIGAADRGDAERLESDLAALGADAVTLVLSADAVLRQDEAARRLEERAGVDRRGGRAIVLVLLGPEDWYARGVPADTSLARLDLAHASAQAVRRWRPEWLFPVADAALLSRLCARGTDDSTRAAAAIRHLATIADSVRAASAATRVGLGGFEPWDGAPGADPLAGARARVFRWAADGDSPIDRVGLVLHAGTDAAAAFETRLDRAGASLDLLAPGKRAWVLECAGSPGIAGESHQARHLDRVLAWARSRPEVEGVSQTALEDGPERIGLVNSLGRRRQAFATYRRAIAGGP